MKNIKHQKPNTRKAPSSKHQIERRVSYWNGASDPGVLKDEPAEQTTARHPFDLEERTAVFGERIIEFAKRIPLGPANNRLIDQIIGAATSVGANYCEANDCLSKKDFRYTIKRCVKEAKETRFFLRMIAKSEPKLADEARELYREATELVRIFAVMYRK